jgi:hypothetical protein
MRKELSSWCLALEIVKVFGIYTTVKCVRNVMYTLLLTHLTDLFQL